MVNEIITAIAQRLTELFGEDAVIHMDELPQGFIAPCFFIQPLTMTQKQMLGGRYYRVQSFAIIYFPASEAAPAAELNVVTDRLWLGMEYIDLADGLARGTEMRREVQDGVLHFFVNYDCFVLKAEDRGQIMQILKQNQKLKD